MKLLAFFQQEILADRLDGLQKLYDAAHITNDMIVRKLHENAPSIVDFNQAIYIDIARVIIDEMGNNPELWDVFDMIYKPRFPEMYEKVRTADEIVEDDYDKAMSILSSIIWTILPGHIIKNGADSDPTGMSIISKTDKYTIFSLLTTRCENLYKYGFPDEPALREAYINWVEREAGKSELYHNDSRIVFTDTEEPIFQSSMFLKFIERQKRALAEYLDIPVETLADYFYEQLKYDVRKEDFTYLTQTGEAGVANQATLHVVQMNYGTSQWVQTITTSRAIRKGSLGYRPDFDKLVEAYYRARVFVVYSHSANYFVKSTLSRECKASNPKDDYISLLYLYNVDVIYQMFKTVLEQNYQTFSWENVTHVNLRTRNQMMIAELRELLSTKDRTIDQLSAKLELNKGVNYSEQKKAFYELEHQRNELFEAIEEKDEIIEKQRQKIRILEEYIEELSKTESETVDYVDIKKLQLKRYLFVGYTDTDYLELRKKFPNSIFMTKETDSLSGIKVDAVVMLIKRMSHSMYYKVRSTNNLKQLPEICCNTLNIDSVYKSMAKLLDE